MNLSDLSLKNIAEAMGLPREGGEHRIARMLDLDSRAKLARKEAERLTSQAYEQLLLADAFERQLGIERCEARLAAIESRKEVAK